MSEQDERETATYEPLEQIPIRVDADRFDAFERALADTAEPLPELKALMQRTPLWERLA